MNKIKNTQSQITSFYEYHPPKNQTFYTTLKTPNNPSQFHLSPLIKSYINQLNLTHHQLNNIHPLPHPPKLLIPRQQPALFPPPLYTFHNIFSI
ncbi:bacillithiol biosynthesis protein BshC, partial [Staphylococcus epidermidis]|uniref:bacillithiol biosynthesis protein BshC n=1 Tax=Staphylococcus epidermidis TaxID=1282 RepID=UPI0028CB5EC9